MTWIGLDVGGANLKAADGLGWAQSIPFALWRDPHNLATELSAIIKAAPGASRIAVTMTGELCDCFVDKAHGIRHIVQAVETAAAGRDVRVYTTDGHLVDCREATERPLSVAASNWHALATFVDRFTNGRPAILLDVGSTTTDIIPLAGGVAARGRTDTERLIHCELVYTGVGRTPICSVVSSFQVAGSKCSIAAELFATTADAYVVLGEVAEVPDATWTADGRGLTVLRAKQRLARMVCADADELNEHDLRGIAEAVRHAQLQQIATAARGVASSMSRQPEVVIVGGAGEFIAKAVADSQFAGLCVVSISDELGIEVSRCAPAHAVAVIARENRGF